MPRICTFRYQVKNLVVDYWSLNILVLIHIYFLNDYHLSLHYKEIFTKKLLQAEFAVILWCASTASHYQTLSLTMLRQNYVLLTIAHICKMFTSWCSSSIIIPWHTQIYIACYWNQMELQYRPLMFLFDTLRWKFTTIPNILFKKIGAQRKLSLS